MTSRSVRLSLSLIPVSAFVTIGMLSLLPVFAPGASTTRGAALAAHIVSRPAHLGVAGRPEWEWFAGRTPTGEALEVTFESLATAAESTLLIRQADVKHDWAVELNGQRIGSLVRMEADLVQAIAVPAGALRTGANTIRIATTAPGDDVVVHAIRLEAVPLAALFDTATLQVRVNDEDGLPLPARVTIVDANGTLAAVHARAGVRQAVRPGVAYVGTDAARVGLLPGTYRVRATRGPEYGMDEKTIVVRHGDAPDLVLRLRRQVQTAGWVAVDTHIHSLEASGHGDASIAERALTLAGEGIELAIATEHDRATDYASAVAAMGVGRFVTPVVGTEVTTRTGHFNVVPSFPSLAILNHPHDTHSAFTPFAPANFNAATGASRGLARSFTAMEVVNSGAMRSDWMEPIRSWFTLLKRGRHITPIGASDSHDVSRFIVGQGRTYVRVADSDPGRVPVAAALASLSAGRVVVSLGLIAHARIGEAGPGELVARGQARTVVARVAGATWVRADRVALFINGHEAAHQDVAPIMSGRVEKAAVTWPLPSRLHDYFVVVIANGVGVTNPAWAIPTPYQPTTPVWSPVVFGLTAPIYVDADGDGVFTSARDYATRLVATDAGLPALLAALADHEPAVSSHAAELLEAQGVDPGGSPMRDALASAAPVVRDGVARYLAAR
jgi:hypothetical protein